jgi:hypothetical protein
MGFGCSPQNCLSIDFGQLAREGILSDEHLASLRTRNQAGRQQATTESFQRLTTTLEKFARHSAIRPPDLPRVNHPAAHWADA